MKKIKIYINGAYASQFALRVLAERIAQGKHIITIARTKGGNIAIRTTEI